MNKYNDHIQAIKKNYPTSGYSALCEALDCAVDLMSKEVESAEKCECTLQGPCEYCKVENSELLIDGNALSAYVEDAILNIDGRGWDGEFQAEYLKINYCPMCGRKLEEPTC